MTFPANNQQHIADQYAQVEINGDGSSIGDFAINAISNDNYNSYIVSAKARGTYAAPIIVQAGDALLTMQGAGYSGSAYKIAAGITMQVDSTPGAASMPGNIIFSTSSGTDNYGMGALSATERMRIDRNGHVGIGNSAPNTNAILDLTNSKNLGFQSPAVTTANLPATPTAGLIVYNSTINCLEYYNGTNWMPMSSLLTTWTATNANATLGTTATYTVGAIAGATYTWTLPSGWAGTSTTNTITATLPANYTTNAALFGNQTITVTVVGPQCGGVVSTTISTVTTVHGTQLFNYSGSAQTATVPGGITTMTAYLWGGGGAGGGSNTTYAGYDNGGGGGGGACTINTQAVTAGQAWTVTIGAGGTGSVGAGTAGGSTTLVNGGTTLSAAGGAGGTNGEVGNGTGNSAGGAGGSTGTGTIHAGGTGSTANSSSGITGTGGGGGGSTAAGTTPGNACGVTGTGGGTAPLNGGTGGYNPNCSITTSLNGIAGAVPGGGGSGNDGWFGGYSGGAGGNGQVAITW